MVSKESVGSEDLVYRSVEYVAKNFRDEITLEKMSYDLCVSKYVLSRIQTAKDKKDKDSFKKIKDNNEDKKDRKDKNKDKNKDKLKKKDKVKG